MAEAKLDLTEIPRKWLLCRAYAHRWDHGKAPIQDDPHSVNPKLWITHGRCTNCAMQRWHYLLPISCAKIGHWEYADPNKTLRKLRLVTKDDAAAELARRDRVGETDELAERRTARKGPGEAATPAAHG